MIALEDPRDTSQSPACTETNPCYLGRKVQQGIGVRPVPPGRPQLLFCFIDRRDGHPPLQSCIHLACAQGHIPSPLIPWASCIGKGKAHELKYKALFGSGKQRRKDLRCAANTGSWVNVGPESRLTSWTSLSSHPVRVTELQGRQKIPTLHT